METGHPSTQAANSGSGDRALRLIYSAHTHTHPSHTYTHTHHASMSFKDRTAMKEEEWSETAKVLSTRGNR